MLGAGLTDAEALMPGAVVGRAFAPAESPSTDIPDSLRAEITVTLNAEIVNTADVAFGGAPTTSAVLTQTFNDLAGRPLTIGRFNCQRLAAPVFSLLAVNLHLHAVRRGRRRGFPGPSGRPGDSRAGLPGGIH